jgi:hypothetical protein
MIDKANDNESNYGASVYATKQIVDTTAVTQALNLIFDRKFVAVAWSNSNKAAYSTNGITWTAATLPSNAGWGGVTDGDGKFVTSAGTSNKAAYSTNCINWTETVLPCIAEWRSVTYGNGKFVVVARNNSKAAYSTDGINWTAATLPSIANWYGVTYGGR